jgi:hypothetical protein
VSQGKQNNFVIAISTNMTSNLLGNRRSSSRSRRWSSVALAIDLDISKRTANFSHIPNLTGYIKLQLID